MEDLIKDDFADGVDRQLIIRNLNLAKMMLVFSTIYSILLLTDWCMYLWRVTKYSSTVSFGYFIFPLLSLAILSLSVSAIVYHIKANRLFNTSFLTRDHEIFNNGFKLVYAGNRLTTAAIVISIISLTVRLFAKQLLSF